MPNSLQALRREAWAVGLLLLGTLGTSLAAHAACLPVAQNEPRVQLASLPEAGELRLTFLGHASFLIESPGGASVVTDYNGVVAPPYRPDAVTMNNAHSTHYTNAVDPRIEHVLRGWSEQDGVTRYDVIVDDMRITNVPTNVRDFGGTRYNGNSIFVFEAAGLCVAHLGHLHHTLEDEHLAALGMIDVVLAPVDGTYTMSHDVLLTVLDQIDPHVVVPMHYFGSRILERFLALVRPTREIVVADGPTVTLARLTLPSNAVIVLPGS